MWRPLLRVLASTAAAAEDTHRRVAGSSMAGCDAHRATAVVLLGLLVLLNTVLPGNGRCNGGLQTAFPPQMAMHVAVVAWLVTGPCTKQKPCSNCGNHSAPPFHAQVPTR